MRADLTFVLIVALSFAAIALGLLRPVRAADHDDATCWSCGQQGGRHRLWCPNR